MPSQVGYTRDLSKAMQEFMQQRPDPSYSPTSQQEEELTEWRNRKVLDDNRVKIPSEYGNFFILSYDPTDKNYVNYIINEQPYLDDEEDEIDDHGITFNKKQDNPVITITSTKFNTIDALILDEFSETPLLSPNVLAFKEMLKYYYFKSIKKLPEINVSINDEQKKSLIHAINAMAVFDVIMNKNTRGAIMRSKLLSQLQAYLETSSTYTEYLKSYIKLVIRTCRTNQELKENRELQFKAAYVARTVPELELAPSSLYRNRWRLLGGGLLIALIIYYAHTKYGIGTILPSRLQGLFKK